MFHEGAHAAKIEHFVYIQQQQPFFSSYLKKHTMLRRKMLRFCHAAQHVM